MKPNMNYRRPILISLLVLIISVVAVGSWAVAAKISGAVIASGTVTVIGNPKSIQHLDGGVITAINVSINDFVEEGDVLVELDPTLLEANSKIYQGRLGNAIARRERLYAELENNESFELTSKQLESISQEEAVRAIEQQRVLLKARYLTKNGEIEQFNERISQYEKQIGGIRPLIEARKQQLDAYIEEKKAVNDLFEKQLASKSQLYDLMRQEARLLGEISEQQAEISRIERSIAETRIAKLQVERQFRERAASEIEEISATIDEVRQQLQATSSQLQRVEVKAPISGRIHQLTLFTIGGVVRPGETLMQIIPQTGEMKIEIDVPTISIDQIYEGQEATLRFPAFHQRTTPELFGEVATISPSSVVNEQTGAAFYRVGVELRKGQLARLKDKKLVPGMPVEGLLKTEDRTVLSYFVKPLMDYLQHALRER